MIFWVDHNLKEHARILLGSIASQGWLDFAPIRFVMFEEVGLSFRKTDGHPQIDFLSSENWS